MKTSNLLLSGPCLAAWTVAGHSLTPQELAQHPLIIPGPMAPPSAAAGNSSISSAANDQLAPWAYTPLPLGSISANGWVLNELNLEARGLAGQLHTFYKFVKDSKWIGGASEYSGLNEGFPYWFNSVVPLAYQLNDPTLIAEVQSAASQVIDAQGDDGWLGPEPVHSRTFWGRYPFCLGLIQMAEADAQMRPSVVTALRNFTTGMNTMLNDNYTNYVQQTGDTVSESDFTWGRVRACDMMISLQWLVENDPEANKTLLFQNMELLRLGGLDWGAWYNEAAYPQGSLYDHPQNFTDANYHYLHGVNVAQGLKAQAVAYRFKQDNESLLQDSENGVTWTFQNHGAASGTIIADEREDGVEPWAGAELCTAVELMYSLSYLYQARGNNDYADMCERAAFNAMPVMITGDWWAHQYMAQANQPYARDLGSENPFYNVNSFGATFGLEPNYPCCTVNHGQGLPKFLAASWVKTGSNGLLHALLSPSQVNTTLESGKVRIDCQTNYPFGYKFTYVIQSDGPFDFAIRIPGWADPSTSQLTVNGQQMQVQADSSTGIQRIGVNGIKDMIEYTIGASIRTEARQNDTVAVYHGALLYSLEIKAQTTSSAPRVYNSPTSFYPSSYAPSDAKDYSIQNETAWNYAIDTSTLKFEANGQDDATPADQPFAPGSPPAYMTAWACEIDWPLFKGVPGSVPLKSERKCLGGNKLVRLVPFGSAKLHMSELPTIDLMT